MSMKAETRKPMPTPTRRKFDGDWDQVDYCYHKILHWFYSRRPNRSRASRFCRTLEPLLKRVANKHEVIWGEECWSLLYEVRGELDKAILYRKSEIRLIKRLLKLKPRQDYYDASDLADRWILLGMLHKEANNIREAIRAVREAKHVCVRSRVKFCSNDLLREYEAEMRGGLLPVRQSRRLCGRKKRWRREKAWTGVNETI